MTKTLQKTLPDFKDAVSKKGGIKVKGGVGNECAIIKRDNGGLGSGGGSQIREQLA